MNTTSAPVDPRPRTFLIAALALGSIILLAGCGPAVPVSGDSPRSSIPTPTLPPLSSGSVTDHAILERDMFLADQQRSQTSSGLAATPAQREFIAAQRSTTEARGGEWSEEIEAVALAAALDACETSILNAHRVDDDVLAAHVASSPLFAAYGTEPASAQGLASIMVFGTRFLCPGDADQWEAAFRGVYGE